VVVVVLVLLGLRLLMADHLQPHMQMAAAAVQE
jgi:hypothetical protein